MLTAMRKEPDHRYSTAGQRAADLRRHLRDSELAGGWIPSASLALEVAVRAVPSSAEAGRGSASLTGIE
jgi:hypothetical protein